MTCDPQKSITLQASTPQTYEISFDDRPPCTGCNAGKLRSHDRRDRGSTPDRKEHDERSLSTHGARSLDYGFALISGDKRTPELLAYVPQGSYHAGQDVGDNGFRVFLSRIPGFIEREIDRSEIPATRASRKWNDPTPMSYIDWSFTLPLPKVDEMKTTWGQDKPYNNQAPMFEMGRGLTGCVATAVGQLMAYHKHPANVNGKVINWKLLHDQTNEKDPQYMEQAAFLLRKIGDLLKNNWGPYSTGAETARAREVLKTFGYYVPKELSEFSADTAFFSLATRRPLIVRGQDERIDNNGTITYSGGHAWIIDGYTRQYGTAHVKYKDHEETYSVARILFHCNWGWRGLYNGYFESKVFYADRAVISDVSVSDKKKNGNTDKGGRMVSGDRGDNIRRYFRYNLQSIPYISPLRSH